MNVHWGHWLMPMLLTMLNVALLGYLAYMGPGLTTERGEFTQETQLLLARCIPLDDLKLLRDAIKDRQGG